MEHKIGNWYECVAPAHCKGGIYMLAAMTASRRSNESARGGLVNLETGKTFAGSIPLDGAMTLTEEEFSKVCGDTGTLVLVKERGSV